MKKIRLLVITLLVSFSFPFLFKTADKVSASTFDPTQQFTYFYGTKSTYCKTVEPYACMNYIESHNLYTEIGLNNEYVKFYLDFENLYYEDFLMNAWVFLFIEDVLMNYVDFVHIYIATTHRDIDRYYAIDNPDVISNLVYHDYRLFRHDISGFFFEMPDYEYPNEKITQFSIYIEFNEPLTNQISYFEYKKTGLFIDKSFNPYIADEFLYKYFYQDYVQLQENLKELYGEIKYSDGYLQGIKDTKESLEGNENVSWSLGYDYGYEVAMKDLDKIKAEEYEKGRQFGYTQGQNSSNNQVNALKGVLPSFLGAIFSPIYEILRTPILGTSILELLLSFASISIIILFLRIFI